MIQPEIRFNGFNDDWTERQLKDILKLMNVVPTSVQKNLPVLTSSRQGLMNQSDYYRDRLVSSKDLSKYHIVSENAITYRQMSDDNVFVFNQNKLGYAGLVSPAYPVMTYTSNVISEYLMAYLNNGVQMKQEIHLSVEGSTRTSLPFAKLSKFKIQLPSFPEQQKIGALFSKYDDIIVLREQKLEELNALKKGMLQQMFPKNGAKVPELRFAGFSDGWEERKLGDVAEVKYGHDYKNVSQVGSVPVYGTGGVLAMIDKCQSESSDAVGLGRKGTINKPFVLKAPFWTVDTLFQIYPKVSLDLFFELYLFNNINWLKYNESTGVPSLSKSNIEAVVRNIPSLREQQKIGVLFEKIDVEITAEQAKIDWLKEQKKGLLERVL